jgi:hypothetical protein
MNITKVKKLAEGGWAIYATDTKTKQESQVGYIGTNLDPKNWLPEGTKIENS